MQNAGSGFVVNLKQGRAAADGKVRIHDLSRTNPRCQISEIEDYVSFVSESDAVAYCQSNNIAFTRCTYCC